MSILHVYVLYNEISCLLTHIVVVSIVSYVLNVMECALVNLILFDGRVAQPELSILWQVRSCLITYM